MSSLIATGLAALALAASAGSAPPASSAWTRAGVSDTSQGGPVERGQAVFHNRCAVCHSKPAPGNTETSGTNGLQFKYGGSKPAALEDRTDLTPALVKFYVRNGSGYMPQFRKTYVSDAELEALSAYLTRAR